MSEGQSESRVDYAATGVDTGERFETGLAALLASTNRTFSYPLNNPPAMDNGFFANVVKVSDELGIAVSTDGVGSKILIAELLEKYDGLGADLVAMNANDVICVGSRPVALVDYIAVQGIDDKFLAEFGEGLREGCRQARISVPAGEIAQVPAMIKGVREGKGFDLVGTCIKTVDLDSIIDGSNVTAGNVIIGIPSSGIHSNGLTLARKVLIGEGSPDECLSSLESVSKEVGRDVGTELLEPTRIYVDEVMAVIDADIPLAGIVHVTGDGFLNLLRLKSEVSYRIEALPQTPAIFDLIQERGGISDSEMYTVFNMGVGLCLVVPEDSVGRTLAALSSVGCDDAAVIGSVSAGDPERTVYIEPKQLVGTGKTFTR